MSVPMWEARETNFCLPASDQFSSGYFNCLKSGPVDGRPLCVSEKAAFQKLKSQVYMLGAMYFPKFSPLKAFSLHFLPPSLILLSDFNKPSQVSIYMWLNC